MAAPRTAMKTHDPSHALQGEAEIVLDFISPCDHCGIPCAGTFELWYIEGAKRKMFVVDRPTLSELLEAAVKAAVDNSTYDRLPGFIRTWNEGVGWAALDEPFLVEHADILAAIDVMVMMAPQPNGDARLPRMLVSLRDFLVQACQKSRELWARET